MTLPARFRCYLVEKDARGSVVGRLADRPLDELPEGEALVRVAYSSLNYKDGLAVSGHPGVVKAFPHVPGIDAVGVVVESGVYELVEGDPVVVAGTNMGGTRWGAVGACPGAGRGL